MKKVGSAWVAKLTKEIKVHTWNDKKKKRGVHRPN